MSPHCESGNGVSMAQFTHPCASYPPSVTYSLYDRLSEILWDFEGKRFCTQPEVPFIFVLRLLV